MKYPRISELGISVVNFDPCNGKNAKTDYVPVTIRFHWQLTKLGILSDFYAFLRDRSKVYNCFRATDVEAALERCMSGRVVEVV